MVSFRLLQTMTPNSSIIGWEIWFTYSLVRLNAEYRRNVLVNPSYCMNVIDVIGAAVDEI